MKKFTLILFSFLLFGFSTDKTAFYWGNTGHRVVGQIAEQQLSNKVKRKISDLLDGQSLALVSTFGDDIKSDKRYSKFYTWHFVNLKDNETYQTSTKNPKGDLVTGIAKCKQVLLAKNASKADKAFYLKMLVHLIGDLHQPLHVSRERDKGGNTFQVRWFNKGTNLHRVWDSQMITSFNMTYSELAANAPVFSKEQIKNIEKGTVVDWVNESHQLAIKVYHSAKPDEKLGYKYMYNHFKTVRIQLEKAGIRLAEVLTEIFG